MEAKVNLTIDIRAVEGVLLNEAFDSQQIEVLNELAGCCLLDTIAEPILLRS